MPTKRHGKNVFFLKEMEGREEKEEEIRRKEQTKEEGADKEGRRLHEATRVMHEERHFSFRSEQVPMN